LFHIFRRNLNGRLDFVGSAQTLESSLKLVKSKAVEPTERFVIYNLLAHEIIYLRADEAVVGGLCPPSSTDRLAPLPHRNDASHSPDRITRVYIVSGQTNREQCNEQR
jgi:hypothetical protein